MSIGDKIYRLRQELDIKQKDLAERVGITEATLSRYENGKRTPSSEIAAKLAKSLGVSTDYLLGNDTNKSDVNNQKHKALSPQVETIAAHLEKKAENITPHKMKMLKRYIDDLFEDFDEE